MYRIRFATHYDLDSIKSLLDSPKGLFGFLPRSAIKQSICKAELIIAQKDLSDSCSPIVGFCRFHKRKDKQTTIYELYVDPESRKQGIGQRLLQNLRRPVVAKCPEDFESNGFYKALGFDLIRIEDGKKCRLNVWRLA